MMATETPRLPALPNADARLVLECVRRGEEEMLSFLERLVCAESPSIVPEAQAEVLAILTASLDELGFSVRRIPGARFGPKLLATPTGRARNLPRQLLLGHCDTVWPIGTLSEMPVEIGDGVMRGPGVFDMKAGLAQIVYALKALRELELRPPVTPVVFVNSDEEIGSDESTRHIRWLARNVDRVFVMEPALGTEGKLKTARKGVGQFNIVVRGRAAHAGLDPEAGASAILELAHQTQELFALNNAARGVSVNVGLVEGGMRPNVIAPEASAVVDVRVPTQDDAARIEGKILGLRPVTEGVELEISGSIDRAPLERTPRNQELWELAKHLADELGIELEQGLAGGASDGNTTSEFTATLDGLGPVGDGAHARHEYIDVARTVERCALLAMLLMTPHGGVADPTTEA